MGGISPHGSVWFLDSSPPGAGPKAARYQQARQQIPAPTADGARAALPYVVERNTPLGRWAKDLSSRAHRNVAIVAFANKLARIAWAVLRRKERFAAAGADGSVDSVDQM